MQDQYEDSIPDIVSLKGMSSYPCPEYENEETGMTAADAEGLHNRCGTLKRGECPYFSQLRRAEKAVRNRGSVVMNYAKWQQLKGNSDFEQLVQEQAPLLVMDESDQLLEIATGAGTWDYGFQWIEQKAGLRNYPRDSDAEKWRNWLPELRAALSRKEEALNRRAQQAAGRRGKDRHWLKRHKELNHKKAELRQASDRLALLGHNFVARANRTAEGRVQGMELIPIAPKEGFAWRTDGQGAGHALLMSATPIPSRMLEELLGFSPKTAHIASVFDPERYPIRLSGKSESTSYQARRADPELLRRWADATLDEARQPREVNPESNALVYARSGANRDELLAAARRHGIEVISYQDRPGDRERAIAKFENSRGAILIGTGVERGLSLDGSKCRVIVIGKAPALPPPSEDPLSEKRKELYPAYREVVEASDFAQASGRAMRTSRDWCEVVITDGLWFSWIQRHKEYLPEETRSRLGANRRKVMKLAAEAGKKARGVV